MNPNDNLDFIPRPIDAVGFRAGIGPNVQLAIGIIQRMTALRAYNSFVACGDWMEKLSNAYVVALATRSADELLMRHIQEDLSAGMPTNCIKCRDASIGVSLIREGLFPLLKTLRTHANSLVHHLDDPGNKGVSDLNIEGVFDYCHHLFQENANALFGTIPNPHGKFPYKRCKKC